MNQTTPTPRFNPRALAILFAAWLVLQVGGLFSPGLLDDVDSVYIEIAREMLHRHDFVTPYIDGIRFFDKPPLMYWLAAGAMRVFGEHDWAARIPLALAMLALLGAVYALGTRLFRSRACRLLLGPGDGDCNRTVPVHALLHPGHGDLSLDDCRRIVLLSGAATAFGRRGARLLPSLGFGAALGLNLLTKGLIGLVFPLGFVLLYLALTQAAAAAAQETASAGFAAGLLAIALPWHMLAALRNPAIAMPAGHGLPAKAGWAWFYLYNEHVARFLGKRIPHDYGHTPVWLFWLYALHLDDAVGCVSAGRHGAGEAAARPSLPCDGARSARQRSRCRSGRCSCCVFFTRFQPAGVLLAARAARACADVRRPAGELRSRNAQPERATAGFSFRWPALSVAVVCALLRHRRAKAAARH